MARAGRQQTEELTPRSARAEMTREISQRHAGERGPLLEILHAVQAEHGYIADEDVMEIADLLNLSVAEVHGTVSFYHDFRRRPAADHEVHVCRAEACQAVGAAELWAAAEERFAHREDVEVREVFCFGNCALGPSASIDGRLRGRVTVDDLATAESGWSR
ncbi:NAD(P)H-dependent oxidoreductase subunit E [uncultured Serinicoccus sp.]|uniref:NADH-quinone oxidoreductase subunit NuoE family protein n=1 Tax=uncultured Serinicoccus sp. TaxID=735514 RepID=UPI002615F250|nr:NAD(P)H-dependent oxidoreductase subunit E [uncultured Serinicoccus sp.]